MNPWRRLRQWFCGTVRGHPDETVVQRDLLWKLGAWVVICRRCGKMLRVL